MAKQQYYIVPSFAKLAEAQAAQDKLITTQIPKTAISNRFYKIDTDSFPSEIIFGSFQKYKPSEIAAIQLKRCGGNVDNIKSGILSVYGMLMISVVAICEQNSDKSRLFTLNPKLAASVASDGSCVEYYMKEIRENPDDVQKNSVFCFEIVPKLCSNGEWIFDIEAACLKVTPSQTITYLYSALVLRKTFIGKLFSRIADIEYFDIKTKTIRKMKTSLCAGTLKPIMIPEVYAKVMAGVINENKALTLRLPDLTLNSNELVDLFIPSVIAIKYERAGLLIRDMFVPSEDSDKKRRTGKGKSAG